MKTAMELALARIEMLYGNKDDIHWEMFKNDCMEKEKEQIMNARQDGHISTYIGCDSGCNGSYELDDSNEDYYNQTYNQNK
jgi:hypothetical protein